MRNVGVAAPARPRPRTHPRDGAVPILMYHSIADSATPANRKWVTTPAAFAQQMQYLANGGYDVVSVSQFVDRRSAGREPTRPVAVLTFDDGYADFLTAAFPVIDAHGFGCTLFVSTQCVGRTASALGPALGDDPLLTWDDVGRLDEAIEIGSHSHAHAALDVVRATDAAAEIAVSRHILTERLGHAPRTFSYPHGHYTRVVQRLVRAAGYDAACTVEQRMSSAADYRYALSRVGVRGDLSIGAFADLVEGATLTVARGSEKLRTHVRRAARRTAAFTSRSTASRRSLGAPSPAVG